MNKILKTLLVVVAILSLIISAVYLWSKHDYDLVSVENISTDDGFINVIYDKQDDIFKEDVLGILKIEKIGLIATVKEGSTKEILNEYIGHISETSKYDGNIGLAAHNRGNKYSYFARINELEEGDIIIYQTKFFTRQYKVSKKIVIYETDWSVFKEKEGENKLTLITCISGKRNQRLCIQAIEI